MNDERSFMKVGAVVAAVAAVLLTTPVAAADRTMTTANVNLRAGAGAAHPRITTLQRGTEVSVDECRQGWCRVEARDVSGWVSARYLVGVGSAATGIVQPYDPPLVRAPPVAVFDFVVPRNAHELGYSSVHKPNRSFHETHR